MTCGPSLNYRVTFSRVSLGSSRKFGRSFVHTYNLLVNTFFSTGLKTNMDISFKTL